MKKWIQVLGILALLPLLAWLSSLIIIGGQVSLSGDDIEEIYGAEQVILLEPVWAALIPLAFALIAMVGFVRNDLRWLWIGGSGLVIAGFVFLFSFGIQLSFFGIAVLLAAFLLHRLRTASYK